jgi:hypothetical protein
METERIDFYPLQIGDEEFMYICRHFNKYIGDDVEILNSKLVYGHPVHYFRMYYNVRDILVKAVIHYKNELNKLNLDKRKKDYRERLILLSSMQCCINDCDDNIKNLEIELAKL